MRQIKKHTCYFALNVHNLKLKSNRSIQVPPPPHDIATYDELQMLVPPTNGSHKSNVLYIQGTPISTCASWQLGSISPLFVSLGNQWLHVVSRIWSNIGAGSLTCKIDYLTAHILRGNSIRIYHGMKIKLMWSMAQSEQYERFNGISK